jgi:Flp pilus assembly secretin CpaC
MRASFLQRVGTVVLAGLFFCAESLPVENSTGFSQSQSPSSENAGAQTAPPQTVPNESQLTMAPHPNPKTAKKASELGEKAIAEGRFDEALAYFQEAARYAPQDENIVQRAAQLRGKLVRDHTDAAERDALAGHADVAVEELAKALLIDPGNTIVAERMKEMRAMNDGPVAKSDSHIEGLPDLKPSPGKQNLHLRGDTKTVYQQALEVFGIKAAFDPDLQPRPVEVRVDGVDFATAMKVLTMQTGTFYYTVTPNLIFVAQDTPEKRRQFAPTAQETFLIPDAVNTEEMTELLRLLRELTGATHIELNSKTHVISVRDTPERLSLIRELIHQVEKARGEVMLEVEILEVDRNKARDLGILPPKSVNLISLTPTLITQLQQAKDLSSLITLLAGLFGNSGGANSSSTLNPSSLVPPLTVVGGGKTTFLLTLPAAAAQFSDALSLVHSGRQVLLRAQDGKPASFFVGDRVPITLSLLSGSLGTTSFVPGTNTSILPSTSYNVGIGPVALTAADFRNLGLLDLAVVNEFDNSISILQNQSDGTFLAATGSPISLGTALTTAPLVPRAIVSTILTTSGFHDLLVTDPVANTVRILLSNGDDTFKEATGSPIAVGQQPSAIVTGDFNGDGNQDFVVTNFTDNTFSLFLGNGDGTFEQATGSPFVLPSSVEGPIAMISADLNADGNLDIVVVNRTTNNLSIFLGDGKGTFTQATNSPVTVGKLPVAIATGDLNNDSKPDLAVVNQTDNTITVLLGNGDGTFASATNSPLATGLAPTGITIADFNADGNADIASTDPQTDSVSVFLGIGQGLFAPAFELPVGTNPTAILSATLSGASLPDVAITDDPSGSAGQVTVILSPASLFSNSGAGAGVAQQPYPGAEYEDIGVKIKATPTLHPNGDVTLQMDFEIRALSGTNINGIPIISNRTLTQTVRIKEGEPTIVSGLLNNQEMNTITGVPGLANLPGVGYAFGQRNNTVQDTELLILITPRKMRLRDRLSRTIYAGRDTTQGRAPVGIPGIPARPPD